jgi:hypothetical protein
MIIDRDPNGVLNMLRAVKTRKISKAA